MFHHLWLYPSIGIVHTGAEPYACVACGIYMPSPHMVYHNTKFLQNKKKVTYDILTGLLFFSTKHSPYRRKYLSRVVKVHSPHYI